MNYIVRDYRLKHRQEDLIHFQVSIKETDLDIGVKKKRFSEELVKWIHGLVKDCRSPLEQYIKTNSFFAETLEPYEPEENSPQLVIEMARAGMAAGVGPMAAVAGTIAECVGTALAHRSSDVIVENGGDIYLRTTRIRNIGIFAGDSPLSNKIALEIKPEQTPLGICTSSGNVGHSLSLGNADAVVILSPSVALADAVATATGNLIHSTDDLTKGLEFASQINGVSGIVIIKDEHLAAWGQVKLHPL